MSEIRTKYSVGDLVYRPSAFDEAFLVACPDCVGQRFWNVNLPSGEEIKIPCPICEQGFEGSQGTVENHKIIGKVTVLTIGSVRVDTNDKERPVSYMCEETGVGSGSVYYEKDLFPTRELADAVLPRLIEEKENALADSRAMSRSRKRERGAGRMVIYYRNQIRALKREMAEAQRHLARVLEEKETKCESEEFGAAREGGS